MDMGGITRVQAPVWKGQMRYGGKQFSVCWWSKLVSDYRLSLICSLILLLMSRYPPMRSIIPIMKITSLSLTSPYETATMPITHIREIRVLLWSVYDKSFCTIISCPPVFCSYLRETFFSNAFGCLTHIHQPTHLFYLSSNIIPILPFGDRKIFSATLSMVSSLPIEDKARMTRSIKTLSLIPLR